jgi:ketosteroid isomerase-like protein
VVSEESTTPDLVERSRAAFEAANRHDLDEAMSVFAPNAVWEAIGMGTSFEGVTAIRGLCEDWIGAYERYEIEAVEILDLGNGVVFAVSRQKGRLAGSSGEVRVRQGTVSIWVDARIVSIRNYGDVAEARAVAERIAESRG